MSEINSIPSVEQYSQPIIDPLDSSAAVNLTDPTCTCGCKPAIL